MEVKESQIFNLINTNGRRTDIVNAYHIYLGILEELKHSHPTEKWERYPKSIIQILFYEKALDCSKDVFKNHKKYESFRIEIGHDYNKMIERDAKWINNDFPRHRKLIDEAIEARARHYTSNLVKIGLATEKTRNITEVGYSFLRNKVDRDPLEKLLPLDNTNLLITRQLAKLKIFSCPDRDGCRTYYSPFFLALYLLSKEEVIDKNNLSTIVQGLNPYLSDEEKSYILCDNTTINDLTSLAQKLDLPCPKDIIAEKEISRDIFGKYFSSSKNKKNVVDIYYQFYVALRTFVWTQTNENLAQLTQQIDQNSTYLSKAFGTSKAIFRFSHKMSLENFQEMNRNHGLLRKDHFNKNFYLAFLASKRADGLSEYSDTTFRLFCASGMIKIGNLPKLAFKDIIKIICPAQILKESIFGKITNNEYLIQEANESSLFNKNISFCKILNYTERQTNDLISIILSDFGTSDIQTASKKIISRKNAEFTQYVKSKFPEDKIMQLLAMFSDRKNDETIKKEVCESASVPTIYEYIISIAWYYLSKENYNLYESINLTLNGNFEPVIHAGGGAGDIIIRYEKKIIMLEVTLMNKNAQKRGEWEPVLRHSLNLKANNPNKETLTFFIADELDINTINIWRAVAAVPLESTTLRTQIDGVTIMPLTNSILRDFLKKKIEVEKILNITKDSFSKVPQITNKNWHEEIIVKCLEVDK